MDLPKYRYFPENNKCNEIEYEIEKDSIYITPFNFYFPFVTNLYHKRSNDNSKPTIDPSFDLHTIRYHSKNFYFERNRLDKIYLDRNNYIDIIGMFNDNKWYPIPKIQTKYKDIFEEFKYLNYEEENNTNIAKEMLKKIKDNNDYWYLPGIIKDYYYYYKNEPKFKKYFIKSLKEFIDILPISIKEKLSKEKDILKNEDSVDDYFEIIANNLIFTLYKIFKKKYEEIKNDSNCLHLIDLSTLDLEKVKDKIKEKRNEYFQINEREFVDYQYDSVVQDIDNENKTEGYNKYIMQENQKPKNVDDINPRIIEEENIEMKEKESEKFKFDISNILLIDL